MRSLFSGARLFTTGLVCSALLLMAAPDLVFAEEGSSEKKAEPVEEANSAPPWAVWLLADEEYRLRAIVAPNGDPAAILDPDPEDETDHDLRLYLSGGFRDPGDHWGADLAAALWMDLDGDLPEAEASGTGSIYDYRRAWWDIFSLAADYQSEGPLRLARIGRQAAPHGLPVTFDGAAVQVAAAGPYLELFAFGGRPVYFFETGQSDDFDSEGIFEDWLASAGAISRPTKNLKIEVDYRLGMEKFLGTDGNKEEVTEHEYGLSLWVRHQDWLLAKVYLRGLDSHLSHAGGKTRLESPSHGFGADLAVEAQITDLDKLIEGQNPYHVILGESRKHLRAKLDLWKAFETSLGDFGLHLGWNFRQVFDSEDDFNQSWNFAYLLAEASDVFIDGLFAHLHLDAYMLHEDSHLSGDWSLQIGAAAGYETKTLRAEVGSLYQRVKYDYYSDLNVSNHVRTTYAQFGYKPVAWLGLRLRYEYENSQDRDVHNVLFALRQSF